MKIQVKRVFLVAVVACAAAAGLAAAPAFAAPVVSGTVSCTGGHAVVGVWVDSSAGGSGFASWQAQPGKPAVASFSRTITKTPSAVSLHVGCGGSTATWWGDNWTPAVTLADAGRALNAQCSEAAGTGTRCTWPKVGASRPTNWFAAGYCTWGAAAKWQAATGSFPAWSGDAKYWATNAGNAGWTVVNEPRSRAVVVMQPGGGTSASAGHVAWVNSYRYSGSTIILNITEMNWTAFNAYDTRDTAYVSGMRFILAP